MEDNGNYPQLYELATPETEMPQSQRPILVHAFEGFLDAGHTIEQFSRIIKEQSELRLVASFDMDEMYDYRGRRPKMTLKDSVLTNVKLPKLELYAAKDKADNPFLLLTGHEPDYRWQRFSASIEQLAKRFGVSKVVGIHAIPTGVPHTRPSVINAHSNNPDLMEGLELWDQEFNFSSSMSTFLDYTLSNKGFDTLGLVVHVPHYLQQSEYPESVRALLQEFNRIANVNFDITEIAREAALFNEHVDEQVNTSDEAQLLIRALEEQYDSYVDARVKHQTMLAEVENLPTGEEIADELEKFLAGLTGNGNIAQGLSIDGATFDGFINTADLFEEEQPEENSSFNPDFNSPPDEDFPRN